MLRNPIAPRLARLSACILCSILLLSWSPAAHAAEAPAPSPPAPSADVQREAHALLRSVGNPQAVADIPAAVDTCRKALALYEGIADRRGQAGAWVVLGALQGRQGDHEGALASFERSARLLRELGDPFGEGLLGILAGGAERGRGRIPEAIERLEGALALFQEIRTSGESIAFESLLLFGFVGGIQLPEGMLEQLEPMMAQVSPMLISMGEGMALVTLAPVLAEAGRLEEAREKLATARRLPLPAGALDGMIFLAAGRVEELAGKVEQAREAYEKAAQALERQGGPALAAQALLRLAVLEAGQGLYSEALSDLERVAATTGTEAQVRPVLDFLRACIAAGGGGDAGEPPEACRKAREAAQTLAGTACPRTTTP